MKHLGYVLPLAAALIGTALFAQEAPAVADADAPKPARELFTTGAGVTDPGVLLFNAGTRTSSFRDGCQAQTFPTQFDLGICPWFDLRAAWDGPTTLKDAQGASRSGGGDPSFGGQFQGLRQDQAGLDLGLAYWHKLPRASVEKGIGTGKADDTLLLTASRTGRSWEFDGNAGANWLGQPEASGRARQGVVSLAVTRAFGAGWNVSLDNVALAAVGPCPRTLTSILAVGKDLTPRVTLDLGVEAGLNQAAERLALDAGVVWRIGRLWGKSE